MRVVALVSGGKDSCYNMMHCVAQGHHIVALANLYAKDKDELDSYMYQTVGHMGIDVLAKAMCLPLYRCAIQGQSMQTNKQYIPTTGDEVEDLYDLLRNIKEELNIEAVAVGAIHSDYQRIRVENVCKRLKLCCLAYLWRRNQKELLQEMIDSGIHAIIIKVASLGLLPDRHLGQSLSEIQSHLHEINAKFGVNICGEGGEYETFTLDCPLFKQKIIVKEIQTINSSDNPICPTGYINFIKLDLHPKTNLTIDSCTNIMDCVVDKFFSAKEINSTCSRFDLTNNNRIICETSSKSFSLNSNSGWIWISGIEGSADDESDGVLLAMSKLQEICIKKELQLSDICFIALYISSMCKYAVINDIYSTIFNFDNPPSRICVECPLPENCHVVLEAIAYKCTDSVGYHMERHTTHIQSISHWAPANIGPYSQSIRIGKIGFISGQIGLVPGTMAIIDGGIQEECALALRHIKRIAMNMSADFDDIVHGMCFLTHPDYIIEARRQWDSCTNNALVDYIIVPALPRQALVEWHVWTHSENSTFHHQETSFSLQNSTIRVNVQSRWSNEHKCGTVICSVICSELMPIKDQTYKEDSNVPLNLSVADHQTIFIYIIEKLLNKYNFSSEKFVSAHQSSEYIPSIHFRIFHTKLVPLEAEQTVEAIQHFENDNCNEINVSYTVLPVSMLHNHQTFLSISGILH